MCSTDLQLSLSLYMVPELTYDSTKRWSSGMHPVPLFHWCEFESRTDFFWNFLSLVLLRNLVFHAQTKLARRGGSVADPVADPVAAVEDSATDAEGSTTPDSTDSVAKEVAAPDTTRGAESTWCPKSNDWGGADDEVLEEQRLKNALGRAERTHKLQTAP